MDLKEDCIGSWKENVLKADKLTMARNLAGRCQHTESECCEFHDGIAKRYDRIRRSK